MCRESAAPPSLAEAPQQRREAQGPGLLFTHCFLTKTQDGQAWNANDRMMRKSLSVSFCLRKKAGSERQRHFSGESAVEKHNILGFIPSCGWQTRQGLGALLPVCGVFFIKTFITVEIAYCPPWGREDAQGWELSSLLLLFRKTSRKEKKTVLGMEELAQWTLK